MILNGATPPFDLQGGLVLAAARGAWVAALCSAAGTLAACVLVAPPAFARMPAETVPPLARRLLRLAAASLLAAMLAGALWLVLQAATMSEADSVADLAAAVPTVALHTSFGRLLLLQLAGVVAASLVLAGGGTRRRQITAGALAGVAVLVQATHGHAASMQPGLSPLLAASVVHVAAAALWLGGLTPLLLLVQDCPPRAGIAAARSFATLGRLCVFGMIGSAAIQSWLLIGDAPGLFGTAYGGVALGKLGLLGVLLGFAAANRYRLAPALARGEAEGARRRLVRSIAVQTGFGLATILAAAVLTSLPPAIHLQPVWPFTVQPSLAAVREDPDFRREVTAAVIALLGAATLLGVAFGVPRRWRALSVALAAFIALLAIPHLDLLLAEAGPTTYFRSPTGFAAASIQRGMALYPGYCASCHGLGGHGDGPAAAALSVPPADLTAAHLWMHDDGELFGWLSQGMAAPDGSGLAMPGFASSLSEDDRWALIDAIRARNAGLARAGTGVWSPPLAAPGFALECSDKKRRTLADLHGQMVRLAIAADPEADVAGLVTIVAGPTRPTSPGRCFTDEPAVPEAYALVSGIAPERLAGAQFLIDANGWLRAVLPAVSGSGRDDPARLTAALKELLATPLPAVAMSPGMAM